MDESEQSKILHSEAQPLDRRGASHRRPALDTRLSSATAGAATHCITLALPCSEHDYSGLTHGKFASGWAEDTESPGVYKRLCVLVATPSPLFVPVHNPPLVLFHIKTPNDPDFLPQDCQNATLTQR